MLLEGLGYIPQRVGIGIHQEKGRKMERAATRVLVVEDDRLTNWSLVSSLSNWGFEVQSVFNGKDAIREIQKTRFDIALLDYQLPDLDGLSIARVIRETQSHAAILLITGYQLNELPENSNLFDIYFSKPLNMKQLHSALQDIVQPGKIVGKPL
jgi:DNA-binding response OmpR family regulator